MKRKDGQWKKHKNPILSVCFLMVCLFSISHACYSGEELDGGKVTLEFSSSVALGKTTTLKATFTPAESGKSGKVFFIASWGAEIVGDQKELWSKDTYQHDFEIGDVKKGEAFEKSVQIRAYRPGILQFVAGIHYFSNGMYAAGDALYAVVTETGIAVYHNQKDIPYEAYLIPNSMGILFPRSGKEEINIDDTESSKYDARRKKDKAKAVFTMYLPKETRLDFDPTYPFDVSYGCSGFIFGFPDGSGVGFERLMIQKQLRQQRHPTWSLKGNIGTIDQNGLFTAIKFGKGDICVTDGVLKDCIDVEVVPLPNPSPPDKIVDTIVVPYDSEEEKSHVHKILSGRKNKPFKSVNEARKELNPKGHKKLKKVSEKNWYAEDVIYVIEGTSKRLKSLFIRADGKTEDKGTDLGNPISELFEIEKDVIIAKKAGLGQRIGEEIAFQITPLEKIEFSKSNYVVKIGTTISFMVYVYDSEGRKGILVPFEYTIAYDLEKKQSYKKYTNPTWEVEGDIGIIDDKGNFMAEKEGEGKVRILVKLHRDGDVITKEANVVVKVIR